MKKKKGGIAEPNTMCAPSAYKEPTPKQVIKREAGYMADQVVRSSAKVKAMKNEIAKAIEAAASKHLGDGRAKSGSY